MLKKKVLICDDQQRFLDSFCERHKDYYEIITVLDSRNLMRSIESPNGLPDIVLLDLYFPYENNDKSHQLIQIAENALAKLDIQK